MNQPNEEKEKRIMTNKDVIHNIDFLTSVIDQRDP